MPVLTCKMCGGDLNPAEGMTTARCPYCGTTQTIPRLDSDQRIRLYERANHFRRRNDYDMAMALYEQILNEDHTDSEAYWSLVLCRYGIEYVEDPADGKRIPTVNRTQYTSILADEDYKAALRYADTVQAELYGQEAAQIDAIQQGILRVSGQEAPYDIFICYKETDDRGERTKDSVLADEVYCQLSREGYRVFFSRVTLREKIGEAYEPYIFAALHSARIMIVIGTDPQNIQSVWVKNEWSRYFSLIQKGEPKVLIPAYRDMDPYNLPKEFSHLQALNMAQLGFMQDLLHGIRKIIGNAAAPDIPAGFVKVEPITLAGAEKIDYQAAEPVKVHKTGWEPYGWKRGVVCGIALVVGITLLNGKGLYQRLKIMQEEKAAQTVQTEAEKDTVAFPDQTSSQDLPKEALQEKEVVLQGILAEFVSRAYQVPAKDVTESRLAKIQQLTISREYDIWHVGYSLDAPKPSVFPLTESGDVFENNVEGLTWIDFSSDAALNLRGLALFTGLKRLDVCGTLSAEDIKNLPLESVSAYFDNPEQASSILENPGAIKELGFNAGVEDLEGISKFENLETLYVDSSELENIDALVNLQHLKNLTLCCEETLTDFDVIGKLSALETLKLEAYGLKSTDFVLGLKHLKNLQIKGGRIQVLYGAENCSALETLAVTECTELRNLTPVESLTGLRELTLDIPYDCREPDLTKLTNLKKLSLSYAQDCSFIDSLTGLTELRLNGCTLPETFDPAKFTSLKALSITYKNYSQALPSVWDFPSLERIDMQGTAVYEDISGVFNMPNLLELNLNDVECEIDFNAVSENAALEVLHMNGVTLYENIQIEGSEGFMSVDYDNVELSEHMDFFRKFPSLRELYLSENGLTDLSFAEEIPTLEVLDISSNYITKLSPLAGLPSLKKVICGENPLESMDGLDDSVLIVGQTLTE